ncbi:TPA: phage protein NinX family protein [Enterobacter kobei]
MDYSQLSDFEINKLVAEANGTQVEETYQFVNGGEDIADHMSGVVLMRKITSNRKHWRLYDPCNSAADAWTIIVVNDISLNSYGSAWEASFEHDAPIWAFGTDETVTSGYEHRNPLRAAMIAFLMKQEHANA